jgi:hypothetical protein
MPRRRWDFGVDQWVRVDCWLVPRVWWTVAGPWRRRSGGGPRPVPPTPGRLEGASCPPLIQPKGGPAWPARPRALTVPWRRRGAPLRPAPPARTHPTEPRAARVELSRQVRVQWAPRGRPPLEPLLLPGRRGQSRSGRAPENRYPGSSRISGRTWIPFQRPVGHYDIIPG